VHRPSGDRIVHSGWLIQGEVQVFSESTRTHAQPIRRAADGGGAASASSGAGGPMAGVGLAMCAEAVGVARMSEQRMDRLAIAVLWLALVVGMIFHVTDDLSGLRYGVQIALPNADGRVPWSNFVIKALFYVVPFVLAVAATSLSGKVYRTGNFWLTLLFLLANAWHLIATAMRAKDVTGYAQILLLIAVLLTNVLLSRISYRFSRRD
jgi:hypothetical protein